MLELKKITRTEGMPVPMLEVEGSLTYPKCYFMLRWQTLPLEAVRRPAKNSDGYKLLQESMFHHIGLVATLVLLSWTFLQV